MNNKTIKIIVLLLLAFVAGMWVMNTLNNQSESAIPATENLQTTLKEKVDVNEETSFQQADELISITEEPSQVWAEDLKSNNSQTAEDIEELTDEKVVVAYLKKHKKLPAYYITKGQAKSKGWVPSKGNLCEVLPGRAIGGDNFSNREGRLPKKKGRKYFEADINYDCGRRDAQRLVYSNDGLIFITKDHYNSFQEL